MPVEPGQSLSHFRITAKIGEGGMGEVYQAQDSKLGRDVAIKVLPDAVAGDPDRLARFQRGAIPVDEAVEVAHERGIIHRDLKLSSGGQRRSVGSWYRGTRWWVTRRRITWP